MLRKETIRDMENKAIRKRNLNTLIADFGTVGALAEAAGTDPNYLSQLRGPKAKRGVGDKLARDLERAAKKPLGWMDHDHPIESVGNVSQFQASVTRIPLISWVQAGLWNEAVDMFEPGYAEDWKPTMEKVGQNAFALRVEGDSMEPEFPAGAIIIVDPAVEPQNGSYVIAKANGQATFKRLVYDAGRAYLKPLNRDYHTIELPEDGEIVGVVVAQSKSYS